MSKKRRPDAQFFVTVTDMRAIPEVKIDHFCEDLRLWLHMHKQVEVIQAQLPEGFKLNIQTPVDAFGWIDDGRHDANINVNVNVVDE